MRQQRHSYTGVSLPVLILSCAAILVCVDRAHAADSYCGAYSAHVALRAIGVKTKVEDLIDSKYITSREGSSHLDLQRLIRDAGAEAIALSGLGVPALRAARHPIILHVASDGQLANYNHWIVFLGMKEGDAVVYDAPGPARRIAIAEVLAIWDGTGLLVFKSEDRRIAARAVLIGHGLFLFACLFSLGIVPVALLTVCFNGRWLRKDGRTKPRFVTGVLWSAAVAMGICWHAFSPSGFIRNPTSVRYVEVGNGHVAFRRMTLAEARMFVDQRKGMLVDARFSQDFSRGHIPGAINIPVDSSSRVLRERLEHARRETPVLVYCESEGCGFDERVAVRLAGDGFEDVRILEAGWREWNVNRSVSR